MVKNSTFFQVVLDDGQVINDTVNNLTRRQIISLANQYRRARHRAIANELMAYQRNKFSTEKG